MKLSNDELIALLKYELEDAQGYDNDTLSEKRGSALDYYYGNMKQAAKGRSNIVSYDVADTVNALMAQAGDIYKSSHVEFPAMHADDERQAQLESDFVKSVIEENDSYNIFDQATFDALLQGNGWVNVIMEQDDTGENELLIRAVAPDVMLLTGHENTNSLQDLRLVAERRIYSVSDLIGMGLSQTEASEIPSIQDDYWTAVNARQGQYQDEVNDHQAGQEAGQLKETFICYYMLDYEQNGEAERYQIHIAGSHIISMQPFPHVPYVTGSPLPIPHRVIGQGMYEQMKQVQDGKTGILRQYMDNLDVQNKSRVGYLKGEVDIEDLLNGRINGAVGMERPDAIIPLPSNNIGNEAIQGLGYLDEVRTSRGGAALDLNNSEMQIASSSALAASQEYAAKEKMSSYYCKNLANMLIKDAFIMVHKTLRLFQTEPLNAKIGGQWAETIPAEWPERNYARITVGMSQTEKMQRITALSAMMQQQQEWIAGGLEGIITDKTKVFSAAADWIKAANITDHPEEYITDPNSPQAKKAAAKKALAEQQAQQQAQQQQEIVQTLMYQLEQQKIEMDKYKVDTETRFDYFKALLENEVKEADLTINATERLLNADNRGEGARDNTNGNRAN